jgi:ABC-type polysaccharide/polyol phosphate export permease
MERVLPVKDLPTSADLFREFFDLVGLIRHLVGYRELIAMMTWQDFSSPYRGFLGGLFWAVIQPLLLMIVYTIVFLPLRLSPLKWFQ